MMKTLTRIAIVALAAVLTVPALAQEKTVHIFGFGGWSVGMTDENPYLSGKKKDLLEWDNAELAIQVTAELSDRLSITGQIFGAHGYKLESESGVMEFEYGFAQWKATDTVDLRVGLLRQPFGLYSEIYDVGTLRPFYHLPQSVYGPGGFVSESVAGIGITGNAGSSVHYDLYVGSLALEAEAPWEELEELEAVNGGEEEEEEEHELEDVVGGRLVFQTPIEGLSFGLSAFSGTPEEAEDGGEASWGDHKAYGGQVEYLGVNTIIRAEVTSRDELDGSVSAIYVEGSYRLNDRWQLAARFEEAHAALDEEIDEEFESLTEHHEWAAGINYWINPNLVFRLSYHSVDGNFFAHPQGEEFEEAIEEGELESSTGVIVFGAQFSF